MKNKELISIGLDFTVSKRELYRKDEELSVNEVGQIATTNVEVETPWFATVNDATNESLGVVGNAYHITQNESIINSIEKIAKDNEYTISHSGPLNGGRQCFVQLRLNDEIQIAGDTLAKFVVATWGHDGKHGIRIGFGNKVASCANQFYQFHNQAQFKMRHNSTVEQQLESIPQRILANADKEQEMYDKFTKWSNIELWKERETMDFRNNLWKDLSGIDRNINVKDYPEHYSSRKINAAMDLQQSINTELGVHGQTLWGLFNGVTHFVNHKKSVPNRSFGRDESLMIGGGAKMSNKAFDKIDAFAMSM